MRQTFVGRCISGLGNRLNNLMNLFYLHNAFPEAEILLDWPLNNHCALDIAEIIHLEDFPWIRRGSGGPVWASTDSYGSTKWDILTSWAGHKRIVSVAFHLYRFVPLRFCIEWFRRFRFKPAILEAVERRCREFGIDRPVAHARLGDMVTLLEREDPSIRSRLTAEIEALDPSILRWTYETPGRDRGPAQIREAVADLLFLTRHCHIHAYCPYSTFSSWVFLLSREFKEGEPIFDTRARRLHLLISQT